MERRRPVDHEKSYPDGWRLRARSAHRIKKIEAMNIKCDQIRRGGWGGAAFGQPDGRNVGME